MSTTGSGTSAAPPRTRAWQGGRLVAEDFPLSELTQHTAEADQIAWVDLSDRDTAAFTDLAETLGLAPHAVEDALAQHERPKLDRYDAHVFLNCHAVALHRPTLTISIGKVSVFVTEHVLITVRAAGWLDPTTFTRAWDATPALAGFGVTGLLHAVLDSIVDMHFDVAQALDDEIEDLEDALFEEKPLTKEVQHRTFVVRKSLVQFRRVVLPLREVLNGLLRRDYGLITADLVPYYQDVYDHVLRLSEWLGSLQDMVATIFDTNLSLQDARLNNIMKKLTSWAAIIAVPTAITGYMGQNVPFPGYNTHWGFWLAVAVMIAAAIALYAGFKKRDWL
jgi:magnesium transporter